MQKGWESRQSQHGDERMIIPSLERGSPKALRFRGSFPYFGGNRSCFLTRASNSSSHVLARYLLYSRSFAMKSGGAILTG